MLKIFSKKKSQGFTFVELMVVIAIIGILASVVLILIQDARNKAKDGKIKAYFGQIKTVAGTIQIDSDSYAGLSLDGDYQDLAYNVELENGGTAPTLKCDDDSYCVTSPLNTGGIICVDSTSYFGTISDASDCDDANHTCSDSD